MDTARLYEDFNSQFAKNYYAECIENIVKKWYRDMSRHGKPELEVPLCETPDFGTTNRWVSAHQNLVLGPTPRSSQDLGCVTTPAG